jgi:D-xylonolactonase
MKIASVHRQYRNVIGESPIANSTYVYWVDTESNQILRLNLLSQSIDRFDVEIPVVAIAFTDSGDFLLASKQGVYLADATFKQLHFICDPSATQQNVRINDAVVSPNGDLWFGTMNDVELDNPDGCIYILKRNRGDIIKFDVGFSVANGIAFSPDGSKVYITNMFRGEVIEYLLSENALQFTSKRVFVKLHVDDGLPDGLTVDAQGNLYIGHWNGNCLSVYSSTGESIDRITLPAVHVTRCTFYGPSLSQLAVTTGSYECDVQSLAKHPDSGHLFLLNSDHKGLSDRQYKL